MDVKCGERRSGKTDWIIKQAAAEFSYIACCSRDEVHRVADRAREMGLDIPLPMTFSELLDGRYYGKGIKGFCIDNLDEMLVGVVPDVPVKAVTIASGPGSAYSPPITMPEIEALQKRLALIEKENETLKEQNGKMKERLDWFEMHNKSISRKEGEELGV